MAAEYSGGVGRGLKTFKWHQIFALDAGVVKTKNV